MPTRTWSRRIGRPGDGDDLVNALGTGLGDGGDDSGGEGDDDSVGPGDGGNEAGGEGGGGGGNIADEDGGKGWPDGRVDEIATGGACAATERRFPATRDDATKQTPATITGLGRDLITSTLRAFRRPTIARRGNAVLR